MQFHHLTETHVSPDMHQYYVHGINKQVLNRADGLGSELAFWLSCVQGAGPATCRRSAVRGYADRPDDGGPTKQKAMACGGASMAV